VFQKNQRSDPRTRKFFAHRFAAVNLPNGLTCVLKSLILVLRRLV
jgi:hypothetical protein